MFPKLGRSKFAQNKNSYIFSTGTVALTNYGFRHESELLKYLPVENISQSPKAIHPWNSHQDAILWPLQPHMTCIGLRSKKNTRQTLGGWRIK